MLNSTGTACSYKGRLKLSLIFGELYKWGTFEDARSPPVVSVGVGSGKIDQRFVEEDAYNNHQCSDGMRSPAERGFDGRGEWEAE